MNPLEGAAEEGGAADSDVDAFFRTGRQGRGRAAGRRAAVWDAAFRTSLGKEGCCWGVRVAGQSPSSRLELPRFLLLWQCWSPFGDGWGLGSPRPSAFIPLEGVCGGEAGGGRLSPLPPSPGARAGAMLDYFAACGSSYLRPQPLPRSSPSPQPSACQLRSCRPGLATLLGPGVRGLDVQKGGSWGPGVTQAAD